MSLERGAAVVTGGAVRIRNGARMIAASDNWQDCECCAGECPIPPNHPCRALGKTNVTVTPILNYHESNPPWGWNPMPPGWQNNGWQGPSAQQQLILGCASGDWNLKLHRTIQYPGEPTYHYCDLFKVFPVSHYWWAHKPPDPQDPVPCPDDFYAGCIGSWVTLWVRVTQDNKIGGIITIAEPRNGSTDSLGSPCWTRFPFPGPGCAVPPYCLPGYGGCVVAIDEPNQSRHPRYDIVSLSPNPQNARCEDGARVRDLWTEQPLNWELWYDWQARGYATLGSFGLGPTSVPGYYQLNNCGYNEIPNQNGDLDQFNALWWEGGHWVVQFS